MNELYTVKEVAERLGVHEETVRRWIHRKELAAIRLGTSHKAHYRVHATDLADFTKGGYRGDRCE